MSYSLIDIAVSEKHAHPRLPGRTTGRVRAVLAETLGDKEQTHELNISVWADTLASMSEADIDMALLLKAAEIIARLKSRFDLTG